MISCYPFDFSQHLQRFVSCAVVKSIKGFKLLDGYRGMPKADVTAVERMLVALSDLTMNHPEIVEIDINPMMVHADGQGATVADCRFILEGHNVESGGH